MLAEKKIFFTEQEYLEQEELSEEKHEFYKGEIFAMSGGTVNHSLISHNVSRSLGNALKDKPCKVFDSNLRIRVNSNGLYTYPDASVVCGKPELAGNRSDTITNPVLIVEVLSESTKNYDRGNKFFLYRGIETLKSYLLVDQSEVSVEHFFKNENGQWVLEEFANLEAVLKIQTPGVEIKIAEFYEKVEFV